MIRYSAFSAAVKHTVHDSRTAYEQRMAELDIPKLVDFLEGMGVSVSPVALLASIAHVCQFTEAEVEQQMSAATRIIASEVLTPEQQLDLIQQALLLDDATSNSEGCGHG